MIVAALVSFYFSNLFANETQFSLSGCSDEKCQLEIGKMLSAIVLSSLVLTSCPPLPFSPLPPRANPYDPAFTGDPSPNTKSLDRST